MPCFRRLCGHYMGDQFGQVLLPGTLTDEKWEQLRPLLPPQKPQTGRPANDHRLIVEGMLWVMRTGSSWRELPERFGAWSTVSSRYQRWLKEGLWARILQVLLAAEPSVLSSA
jgi:transposase